MSLCCSVDDKVLEFDSGMPVGVAGASRDDRDERRVRGGCLGRIRKRLCGEFGAAYLDNASSDLGAIQEVVCQTEQLGRPIHHDSLQLSAGGAARPLVRHEWGLRYNAHHSR